MIKNTNIILVMILLFAATHVKSAEVINIGLPYTAKVAENKTDDIPKFIIRVGELSEQIFHPVILPFQRVLSEFNQGHLDMAIMAYLPIHDSPTLPYQYTKATFWDIHMVLYTHKDSPVNLSNLSNYNIMTERVFVDLFDFPINATVNIESAIKMVDSKRIDGVIFVEPVVDAIIRNSALKNIKRVYHSPLHIKALIHRNENVIELDNAISLAIDKMKKSGELKEFTAPWTTYDNWQPYQIAW